MTIKDSLISDIWVVCQERVIWQEFADRFAVCYVMRDANLSLQEMVLNFWISLVLAVTTVSYERLSLNLSLNLRHFPRIKVVCASPQLCCLMWSSAGALLKCSGQLIKWERKSSFVSRCTGLGRNKHQCAPEPPDFWVFETCFLTFDGYPWTKDLLASKLTTVCPERAELSWRFEDAHKQHDDISSPDMLLQYHIY